MPGKRGYSLIASRIQDPAIQLQASPAFQQRIYGLTFVAKVTDRNEVGCVFRVSSNRLLIVDDADRNLMAAKAPDNAQALIIAANDDRAHVRDGEAADSQEP